MERVGRAYRKGLATLSGFALVGDKLDDFRSIYLHAVLIALGIFAYRGVPCRRVSGFFTTLCVAMTLQRYISTKMYKEWEFE